MDATFVTRSLADAHTPGLPGCIYWTSASQQLPATGSP